ISSVIEYTFPNFNRWNWKSFIGYDNFFTLHQVGFEFLYCLSWLLVLLTLTVLIFRRKEFV
ncbi:MAG: hypothetical protein KDD25_03755, partial [Bdellovibrionales bacterium]|nr:hypothetical protein [Bdellovibrionales bacterium]